MAAPFRLALVCLAVLHGSPAAAVEPVRQSAAGVAVPLECGAGAAGEACDALGGDIAAALVLALSERFGGRAVELRLERMVVGQVDDDHRQVDGAGEVSLAGAGDPVGFRFTLLHDRRAGVVDAPDVVLGAIADGERELPNDPAVLQRLDAELAQALSSEFRQPVVRLQLDRIRSAEAGTRYLQINATGIVDFGRNGSTPARVDALYDRVGEAWVRLHYDLAGGGGADVALTQR